MNNNVKTYPISTLRDIWNLPTIEQMKTCLDEIASGMIYGRMVTEHAQRLAREAGESDAVVASHGTVWPDPLPWIDDGKGEVGCEIFTQDGKHIMTAMLRPAEDAAHAKGAK